MSENDENLHSRNLKVPLLKIPELKVKQHQRVSSYHNLSPLIHEIKDNNNSFVLSTNEEINYSLNEFPIKQSKTKNYLSSSFNISANETNRSYHKSNNTPILKSRTKNHFNNIENNPNIKRINIKSNFHKKIRYDYFGNEINHKNKKNVKISFRDQIDELQDFCDIIEVESIKEYIKVYGKVDRKDTYVRDTICSSCSCFIF